MGALKFHTKCILIVIIILFSWSQSFSQKFSYKHYTVEDGLPSSEVYSAFQDSKGYMWFATDAGVSRFNGYEFENFDSSDGLTDNTVFLITEDKRGRIWFGTFNCRLSYFENDSIYAYKYNDNISAAIKEKSAMISFQVDSNENIWMGFYRNGINRCNIHGVVDQIIEKDEALLNLKAFFKNKSLVQGAFYNREGIDSLRKIKKAFKFNISVDVNNNTKQLKHFIDVNSSRNNFTFSEYRSIFYLDQILTIALGSQHPSKGVDFTTKDPISYNVELPKEFANKRLLSIYSNNENLYFTLINQGVYKCVLKDDKIVIKDHYFKKENISRVFKDNVGSLWIMSLDEGIYYIPTEKFNNIPIGKKYGEKISLVEVDSTNKKMYAVKDEIEVSQIDDINGGGPDKIIYQSQGSISKIHYNYKDDGLLIGASDKNILFKKGQFINYNYSIYGRSTRAFMINSDTIFKVNNTGLSIDVHNKEIYNSFPSNKKMWCTSLIKNGNKIWIGTNEGVRVYYNKKIMNPFSKNKYLSTSITAIERLNKSLFLIGTKSYGVLVIEGDSIIDIINNKDGLIGNLVRKIHVDHQKSIWIGTNNGLCKVDYRNVNNFQLYNITQKHGLASGEITDIKSYQKTIYVATLKGLVRFDKTKIIPNTNPPPVYIKTFTINEKERKIGDNNQLKFKENNINITYEGLNYRSVGEVEYQYRMLGIDTNWITTTTRGARFTTLPANDYIFEVKAKNEDGFWSEPANISFTINPPFWLTWWFIMLEIVLVLYIIIIIFKYRVRQINKKNKAAQKITETEKRMVELELKALRSQMNPHFIFNTLNSIQHYIAENDFKRTNKYLTQFAKLIRTVLNLSEKNFCTIQEELGMLRLYMDLEKMRFEEQFDYEINVDNKIDEDYDEIPSMLIQPYVENAIWHGLMNKDEKGKIKIDIELKENYIRCSIEDNGIGREKAAAIKAKRKIERKSVGMSITKERLGIINEEEINVKIIDLENDMGNAMGTKITIKIPYLGS
jgi:ligand-binding sensor domain-containing protein